MFAVVNIPNECSILNDLIQNRDLLITSARYLSVGLSGYIFRNWGLFKTGFLFNAYCFFMKIECHLQKKSTNL